MDNMAVYDMSEPVERILVRQKYINGKLTSISFCRDCNSENIRVSKKGNKYCADLCWVDNSTERKV